MGTPCGVSALVRALLGALPTSTESVRRDLGKVVAGVEEVALVNSCILLEVCYNSLKHKLNSRVIDMSSKNILGGGTY